METFEHLLHSIVYAVWLQKKLRLRYWNDISVTSEALQRRYKIVRSIVLTDQFSARKIFVNVGSADMGCLNYLGHEKRMIPEGIIQCFFENYLSK